MTNKQSQKKTKSQEKLLSQNDSTSCSNGDQQRDSESNQRTLRNRNKNRKPNIQEPSNCTKGDLLIHNSNTDGTLCIEHKNKEEQNKKLCDVPNTEELISTDKEVLMKSYETEDVVKSTKPNNTTPKIIVNNKEEHSSKKDTPRRSKRKPKNNSHKPTDTVMDMLNKTITICIEEVDTDDENSLCKSKKHTDTVENQCKKVTEKKNPKDDEGKEVSEIAEKNVHEQADNFDKKKTEIINYISVSDDSVDTVKGHKDSKTGNYPEMNESDKNDTEDSEDHSIEHITPSIQSDPVLQQDIPVGQHTPIDFSGQVFSMNKESNTQHDFYQNGLNNRCTNLHDEDAMAAARLMTDMAASKTIPYTPHSHMAETNVTNSGYGYCNSGDRGDSNAGYNRQPGQPYINSPWQPAMFAQPHDPYRSFNQWEGNFHNVAMYDSNNNLINPGHSMYQGTENFRGTGMSARSNMTQHRVPYELENEDGNLRLPQDYRHIHQIPMPMPLDYSVPQTPIGLTGQNIPFREVVNGASDTRRQVRKIVLLDPNHGKRKLDDDEESPVKRNKRSRNSQVSSTSVTNYDEIVKNLFVPAPPTKTVLIQPKFLNKERGSNVNDIDPTQVRSISHRGLIRKYIDYLLMENEYITEISKAVSLPMDNCVMDDPYLMDVIRIKIPFPTPKYMQFLKDFYPAIQVDWRALNHQLEQYRSGGDGAERFHTYYLDNRAVPVLLGEAFYFFQRESDRKAMEKNQR